MVRHSGLNTKMVVANAEDKTKNRIFQTSVAIMYLLYFFIFAGVSFVNVKYVHILVDVIHVGICLFLMWRFNPFIEHVLRPYDSDIIFASASALLINTFITAFGTDYITNIVNYFKNMVKTKISSVAKKGVP
jgi:hypothetical protein